MTGYNKTLQNVCVMELNNRYCTVLLFELGSKDVKDVLLIGG
jgi:hypothetical protein